MRSKVGLLRWGGLALCFIIIPMAQAQEWDSRMDYNNDGIIDGKDLLIFMRHWRQRVPIPTPTPTPSRKVITIQVPGTPDQARAMEMVHLPAGTFMFGSPINERGRTDVEWLPHSVTITQDFYMGRYEVTQGQWKAVMGNNPALGYGVGDNYPVYNVSWNDCVEFIKNLNKLGLGYFYLPTEAQWEYACRAETTTRFSFGDALECPDTGEAACSSADRYIWWMGNNTGPGILSGPKIVGLRLPNFWGLYDMHGNMKEWCNDWWELPYERGAQFDPKGPVIGSAKVIRGGGWSYELGGCRSAVRSAGGPTGSSNVVGFRLVRMYP